MNTFTIIKSDYLQRTRSYTFLVTLCISLAVAYTFIPEPNATYSTIRISNYVGVYNSAWIAYVTAIMASIFLSLVGFYLVNGSIKTDIQTKAGQIVASTPISNFRYLFSKVLSNFLVLLTIVLIIFSMSILLFFLYNEGFTFELLQFIKPYFFITIPAMFFIATLAVIFEVFFGKYSVIQNVGFFFLFFTLMVLPATTETQFLLDVFGSEIITHQMENQVKEILQSNESIGLNIGYVIGNEKEIKRFNFEGVNFPTSFLLSRIGWILLCIISIVIISPFFHRFNVKEKMSSKKSTQNVSISKTNNEVVLSALPKAQINYGIFSLLKTELLLLFRKGKKWLWIINLIGMGLLVVLPLEIADQIVLPVLWFLQVNRLSELTTKEVTNNVHYFAFTSYKPLSRLLVSQVLAGIILMLFLVFPLLIRLLFIANFTAVFSVVSGGVFITLLASTLGIVTKGKKLFEVLFFMIAYANINGAKLLDYFGGLTHNANYILKLTGFILLLIIITFLKRKIDLKKN
ncbi:MAG: hypothetical protein L3J14_02905 [Flavobacteriaceae bacterium]|nr:hypothetical protein [Flavobacteriaceae bacterium]